MNELKRLQRKLIPVNIVVSIISLVAAISIMFAPLLTIDVDTAVEKVVAITEDDGGEEDSDTSAIISVVRSLGDMKLTFTAFSMLTFAFSDDPIDHVAGVAAEKMKQSEDEIIASVAIGMIPQLIENGSADVDIDTENIDVPAILEKFDEVFNANGEEQTQEAINNLVDELQAQAVSSEGEQLITDEMKEDVKDVIKELLDQVIAELGDEDLTLESFICVTISKFLNGSADWLPSDGARKATAISIKPVDEELPENSSGEIYTNYHDLINGLFGAAMSGESGDGETENVLGDILEIAIPALQIFTVTMVVFALVWIIQFLFAFLHIFLRNKRFMMWYTKLWGFVPCFIFWALPLLASLILPLIFPEMAAYLAILTAISSLAWISGICYLLLWLVSIFWAFPIKHKIRKLLSQGATYD